MHVLLVEDYPPLRDSLAQGLREAGYAVDCAADGETALWHARNDSYDVIVLDLMLPKVSGMTLLKQLRNEGNDRPVLILTAKDTVPDRVAGLDAGADDYLVKPFAVDELLARMRALIRRQYSHASPTIKVGELCIDTAAQRVWRGEEEVALTAREYALLDYLVARKGQVVSRTDIWSHVYDFYSDAHSNVVDVYVGYLRRKLGSGLIRTIRGSGYKLDGSQ